VDRYELRGRLKARLPRQGRRPDESNADEDDDIPSDAGLWLSAEYVSGLASFVSLKAYATFIHASEDGEHPGPTCRRDGKDCDVGAHGLMLGGKGRLALPIPWVAPFIELGLGVSGGHFVTDTVAHRFKRNVLFHLPLALGVALGPDYNAEVALAMYQHFAVQQIVFAFTLSLSIPLDGDEPSS